MGAFGPMTASDCDKSDTVTPTMGAGSECDGHIHIGRGADIVVENMNGGIAMEEGIHWNSKAAAVVVTTAAAADVAAAAGSNHLPNPAAGEGNCNLGGTSIRLR